MENKSLTLSLKAIEDQESGIFEGYASTFGNIDHQDDIIKKGAFANSLKVREPKVLLQHDMKRPIGKVIDIREDDNGLYVKTQLAIKTIDGRDAFEHLKAGTLDRMSIGYMVKQAEYDTDRGVRIIKEAELYEFSLVTIPVNDEAKVTGVKNAIPETPREFEKFLRDNGYSQKAAKAITADGIKGYKNYRDDDKDIPSLNQRDVEELKNCFNQLLVSMKG